MIRYCVHLDRHRGPRDIDYEAARFVVDKDWVTFYDADDGLVSLIRTSDVWQIEVLHD